MKRDETVHDSPRHVCCTGSGGAQPIRSRVSVGRLETVPRFLTSLALFRLHGFFGFVSTNTTRTSTSQNVNELMSNCYESPFSDTKSVYQKLRVLTDGPGVFLDAPEYDPFSLRKSQWAQLKSKGIKWCDKENSSPHVVSEKHVYDKKDRGSGHCNYPVGNETPLLSRIFDGGLCICVIAIVVRRRCAHPLRCGSHFNHLSCRPRHQGPHYSRFSLFFPSLHARVQQDCRIRPAESTSVAPPESAPFQPPMISSSLTVTITPACKPPLSQASSAPSITLSNPLPSAPVPAPIPASAPAPHAMTPFQKELIPNAAGAPFRVVLTMAVEEEECIQTPPQKGYDTTWGEYKSGLVYVSSMLLGWLPAFSLSLLTATWNSPLLHFITPSCYSNSGHLGLIHSFAAPYATCVFPSVSPFLLFSHCADGDSSAELSLSDDRGLLLAPPQHINVPRAISLFDLAYTRSPLGYCRMLSDV